MFDILYCVLILDVWCLFFLSCFLFKFSKYMRYSICGTWLISGAVGQHGASQGTDDECASTGRERAAGGIPTRKTNGGVRKAVRCLCPSGLVRPTVLNVNQDSAMRVRSCRRVCGNMFFQGLYHHFSRLSCGKWDPLNPADEPYFTAATLGILASVGESLNKIKIRSHTCCVLSSSFPPPVTPSQVSFIEFFRVLYLGYIRLTYIV